MSWPSDWPGPAIQVGANRHRPVFLDQRLDRRQGPADVFPSLLRRSAGHVGDHQARPLRHAETTTIARTIAGMRSATACGSPATTWATVPSAPGTTCITSGTPSSQPASSDLLLRLGDPRGACRAATASAAGRSFPRRRSGETNSRTRRTPAMPCSRRAADRQHDVGLEDACDSPAAVRSCSLRPSRAEILRVLRIVDDDANRVAQFLRRAGVCRIPRRWRRPRSRRGSMPASSAAAIAPRTMFAASGTASSTAIASWSPGTMPCGERRKIERRLAAPRARQPRIGRRRSRHRLTRRRLHVVLERHAHLRRQFDPRRDRTQRMECLDHNGSSVDDAGKISATRLRQLLQQNPLPRTTEWPFRRKKCKPGVKPCSPGGRPTPISRWPTISTRSPASARSTTCPAARRCSSAATSTPSRAPTIGDGDIRLRSMVDTLQVRPRARLEADHLRPHRPQAGRLARQSGQAARRDPRMRRAAHRRLARREHDRRFCRPSPSRSPPPSRAR